MKPARSKKLSLARQTLRNLTDDEARAAGGGVYKPITFTDCISKVYVCPNSLYNRCPSDVIC